MALSLVLGPMVRHINQTSAAVWVEVSEGATLVGRAVLKRRGKVVKKVDSRVAHTVRVDRRYYAMLYFEKLEPASLYTYEIVAAPDGRASIKTASAIRKAKKRVTFDLMNWTYGSNNDPAFRTLPKPGKESLRLAFGSCRCAGGGYRNDTGMDVLDLYGQELAATHDNRLTHWPQMLLMLGDQVYADNVGQRAVKAISKGGRPPKLPSLLVPEWPGREAYIEQTKNEGMPVPEYAGAGGFRCVRFEDYARLYGESWIDLELRRLFANIPSFMIPDDHDVADDWNISGGWLLQATGDPDWLDALTAGLVAYWVYQGWGNLSRTEAEQHAVTKILATEHKQDARKQLVTLLEQHIVGTERVPLYFTIPTTPPIIAVDARSDRTFKAPLDVPADKGGEVTLFTHEDDEILGEEQWIWLEGELARHDTPIVICSVPLLQTPVGDRLMARNVRPPDSVDNRTLWPDLAIMFEMALRNNDADTWFAFPKSVTRLLELLAKRKATVFLAGDVHYSYVFDVKEFSPTGGTRKKKARLIHAVSSPMQHEMDKATLDALKSYADERYRDASGEIANQFGDPGQNPVRNQFKLPVRAFAALAGPREILEGAYSARNLIARMELASTGVLTMSWFGEPLDTHGELTLVGRFSPEAELR